ncbi:MAG: hypothetical protein ACLFVX_10025 [Archaeoglobaceae archaeon]
MFPEIANPELFVLGITFVFSFGLMGQLMVDSNDPFSFMVMSLIGTVIGAKVLGWLPGWFLLMVVAIVALYLAQKWSDKITGKVRRARQ